MSTVHERTISPIVEAIQHGAEIPVCHYLERHGFIPVEEDTQTALTARIDVLHSLWALNGQDHLLTFEDDGLSNQPDQYDPRIDQLAEGLLTDHWEQKPSARMQAALKRLLGVPQRKELLMRTLGQIYGYGAPTESADVARHRLSMMLDAFEGKMKQPQGIKRGVIFTQTAYLLGNDINGKKETQYPIVPHEWAQFAVELGSGALPYLGSAVVYAELMGTGQFQDIEIVDFRDKEAIQRITANPDRYDMAFISGATTYDRSLIDNLNKHLSDAGLRTINGGVAPTIDEDPGRYLANGASVYIGEFEGAADELLALMEQDESPRVFVRGGDQTKIQGLKEKSVAYETLDLPARGDMMSVYDLKRERSGYLAHRLEAMEKMRISPSFGGKRYEAAPFFRFHEIVASYGCPEACSFCATVPFQGRAMRHRPIESIEQEFAAIESPVIAIVDQNFLANGRDYVEQVLMIAKKYGKRIAFEGELLFFSEGRTQLQFFDGTPADRQREELLKRTVTAIQVGLEQPVKVGGTVPAGKNPEHFAHAMERLNNLGIPVFGTAIIGMPQELWAPGADTDLPIIPYTSLNEDTWQQMVDTWVQWFNDLHVPGIVPFAFTVIPGTPAHQILRSLNMLTDPSADGLSRRKETEHDLSPSIDPNVVKGIDARRGVEAVRRAVYRPGSIWRRVSAANYTLKKFLFMMAFNALANKSLRDRME